MTEDDTLISGLTSNLTGGLSPFTSHAWDGDGISTNTVNPYFDIGLSGVRVFGIGITDNDGGSEDLIINGGDVIDLSSLSNFVINGQGRAYYLKITAGVDDDDISNITFLSGNTIPFDHLALGTASIPVPEPSNLLILGLCGLLTMEFGKKLHPRFRRNVS